MQACARSWTDQDKSDFLGGCLHGPIRDSGQVKARAYCHCMLEKMMQRYPNANDAKYMQQDTALPRISREC